MDDVADILVGKWWIVETWNYPHTAILLGFVADGLLYSRVGPSGTGLTLNEPHDSQGHWQSTVNQLFFSFSLSMGGHITTNDHYVQFTRASDAALDGIDKFARQWRFRPA